MFLSKRSKNKAVLAIIIMSLCLANYHICNFVFGDNLTNWWKLKLIIINFCFALCFTLARIGTRGLARFVLSLGIGFFIAGIFDRIFFNIQQYRWIDLLMITITVITSYIEVYVNSRSRRA